MEEDARGSGAAMGQLRGVKGKGGRRANKDKTQNWNVAGRRRLREEKGHV